jgi:hypothetical protein
MPVFTRCHTALRRDWILSIFGYGGVHPFLGCVLVSVARETGKGRVTMISKVKPLLVPSLVGRNPLHGDVLIGLGIMKLEHTTTNIHWRRTPLLRVLEEDGPEKVVLPQDMVGLNAQITLAQSGKGSGLLNRVWI